MSRHDEIQSGCKALAELLSVTVIKAQPGVRAFSKWRVKVLALSFLAAVLAALAAASGKPIIVMYLVSASAGFITLFAFFDLWDSVSKIFENPLTIILRKMPSEFENIVAISHSSFDSLEFLQIRINAQIETFEKRAAATAIFPKVLVAGGLIFAAFFNSDIVKQSFPSLAEKILVMPSVWAPVVAALGLGFILGEVCGKFEVARLREYLLLLDGAMHLRKVSGTSTSESVSPVDEKSPASIAGQPTNSLKLAARAQEQA